jgi:hypothetical protein
MNRERLILLMDVLNNVPADHFNMNTWGMHTVCGTAACALGWAALDPRMNEQGLVMFFVVPGGYRRYTPSADVEPLGFVFTPGIAGSGTFAPTVQLAAAMQFFDITYETAEELFTLRGYGKDVPLPSDVINKIVDLLLRGERV